MGDKAVLRTLLLSQLAQPEVKVVLMGDGGDEFFADTGNINARPPTG